MATPEIHYDTIEGAGLESSWGPASEQVTQYRTGYMRGIDVFGGSDAEVLNRARAALLADTPFGTGHPSGLPLVFNRLVFRPINGRSDALRFEMRYQTGSFSGNAAYLLRYSTTLQSYTTRFLPGRLRKKRLAAKSIEYTDAAGKKHKVKANSIAMNLMRPCRTISVTSIVNGVPELADDEIVGLVNGGPWNGKDAGYWLITSYETDISFYQGFYQVSATVMTKGNENWNEVGVLVDPTTGLTVEVDEGDLDLLLSTYEYGVFPGDGFVVVGPYETANFDAIFGA